MIIDSVNERRACGRRSAVARLFVLTCMRARNKQRHYKHFRHAMRPTEMETIAESVMLLRVT